MSSPGSARARGSIAHPTRCSEAWKARRNKDGCEGRDFHAFLCALAPWREIQECISRLYGVPSVSTAECHERIAT